MGQTLYGFCYECVEHSVHPTGTAEFSHVPPPQIFLSPSGMLRWRLASQAVTRYNLLDSHPDGHMYIKGQYIKDKRYQEDEDALHDTLTDRRVNWPSDINITRIQSVGYIALAYIGFTMAGSIYGGLHLIAWNAPFASQVEKLLWRISGLVLALSGPACAFLYILWDWFQRGIAEWKDEPLRSHSLFIIRAIVVAFQLWVAIGYYSVSVILVAFALTYVGARLYLVVECFVNMAHLPASVFELPVWTQYFPHIV